jgi:hypothetical protein
LAKPNALLGIRTIPMNPIYRLEARWSGALSGVAVCGR